MDVPNTKQVVESSSYATLSAKGTDLVDPLVASRPQSDTYRALKGKFQILLIDISRSVTWPKSSDDPASPA